MNESIFNQNFQEFEQLIVNDKILIIPKNIIKLIPYFNGITQENISNEWKQSILKINNIDYDLLNLIFIYLIIPDFKIFSGCSLESLIELLKICDLLLILKLVYKDIFKNIDIILPFNKNNENLFDILNFLYDITINEGPFEPEVCKIKKNIILKGLQLIDENSINYNVSIDSHFKLIRNSKKLLISYINNYNKNELINIIDNNLTYKIFYIVFNKLLEYNYFTTNDLQNNSNLLNIILEYDLFYDYIISNIFDIISFFDYIHNIENFDSIKYNFIILKILFGNNYNTHYVPSLIIGTITKLLESSIIDSTGTAVLLLKLNCENKIKIIKKSNKVIGLYLLQYLCNNNSICLCCKI
jgi:hypothetical protein